MPIRYRTEGYNYYAWVIDELRNRIYTGFNFTGNAGYHNNFLTGGKGDDTIRGVAVWNNIHGDAGNDSIIGAVSGYNCLYGETGNDSILGGRLYDCIDGGVGDDTLFGNDGNDVINGDFGNDSIDGGNGDDKISDLGYGGSIFGGNGDDKISVNVTMAKIYGGDGNDTIEVNRYGLTQYNNVNDDKGDDRVFIQNGYAVIGSSDGADFYDLNNSSNCEVIYVLASDSTTRSTDTFNRFNGRNADNRITLYSLNYATDWRYSNSHNNPGDVHLASRGNGNYDLWVNCGPVGMLFVKFTNSYLTNANLEI